MIFTNPTKFFNKNKMLIGIVLVVLIIITIYLFYVNMYEGFEQQPVLEKAQLIPVSTIEKIYNQLPNQTFKDIFLPIMELYKLFVANYNDAFDVYRQILQLEKEIPAIEASEAAAFNSETNTIRRQLDVLQKQRNVLAKKLDDSNMPVKPGGRSNVLTDQQRVKIENNINTMDREIMMKNRVLDEREREQVYKREMREQMRFAFPPQLAQQINPGVEKVLINAVKWLPNAKQYYDKFAANNFYGLYDNSFVEKNLSNNDQFITLYMILFNTLYEDDQLSIIFGPTFSKSNPNPPLKMPLTYEQFKDPQTADVIRNLDMSAGQTYMQKLIVPFMIIQRYVLENTFQSNSRIPNPNGVIPNTIVQLIEQLNNALANDATDQATITNLQARVDNLQKQKTRPIVNDGPIRTR